MAAWKNVSMSLNAELAPIVPPLLSELCLNFPAGTVVVVKTCGFGTFRGTVFQNPSDTGIKNSLTVIDVVNNNTGEAVPGHLSFFQNDIVSVSVIQNITKMTKKPINPVMDTCEITTLEQLRNLLEVLRREVEVGCYIPGTEHDPLEIPSCVLLNLRHIFVVIPFSSFVGVEHVLWENLGKGLFANGKLTKVFWDSRGTVKYLYHHQNLPLTNAFDLRLMGQYVNDNGTMQRNNLCSHYNELIDESSINLADMLKKYSSFYVPAEDIEILSKFSRSAKLNTTPSQMQSRERKYCALKVKYLLLLKSGLHTEVFKPWKILTERVGRKIMEE